MALYSGERGFAGPQIDIRSLDDKDTVIARGSCDTADGVTTCDVSDATLKIQRRATPPTAQLEDKAKTFRKDFVCEKNDAAMMIACRENPSSGTSPAVAAAGEVECTGKINGKNEEISVKLDNKGQIVPGRNRKFAKSTSTYLKAFAVTEDDVEDLESEVDRGVAILSISTTADKFILGVNSAAGSGYFEYEDTGSGAGDMGPFKLVCTKKPSR